jgi:hypothetical protein
MNIVVTADTDDQALTTARGHHSSPLGLFGPIAALEVFQPSNMVGFDVRVRFAEFASSG